MKESNKWRGRKSWYFILQRNTMSPCLFDSDVSDGNFRSSRKLNWDFTRPNHRLCHKTYMFYTSDGKQLGFNLEKSLLKELCKYCIILYIFYFVENVFSGKYLDYQGNNKKRDVIHFCNISIASTTIDQHITWTSDYLPH